MNPIRTTRTRRTATDSAVNLTFADVAIAMVVVLFGVLLGLTALALVVLGAVAVFMWSSDALVHFIHYLKI